MGTILKLDNLPLLKCGWVYQERLLSRCVLHYVGREVIRECHQSLQCQCLGDLDLAVDGPLPTTKRFHTQILERFHARDTEQGESVDYSLLWHHMVQGYTHLDVTYFRDRLPAISGLADHLSSMSGSVYCDGLWRDIMASDLCWYVHTCQFPGPKPRQTPSWCWAP